MWTLQRKLRFILIGLLLTLSVCRADNGTQLTESGSTLLYPLMRLWVQSYEQTHPNVEISTASTGSGAGIADALSGASTIGASDAYLSDAQMALKPMLNIPLAVSAQQIAFNLPELPHTRLRLSGPVLSGMYDGTITLWSDPRIARLNPGVSLPSAGIVPIHRADGSGDTFIFTQFLSLSTSSWRERHGFGTKIAWPDVANAQQAPGNAGVLDLCARTPYSITYLGVSYSERAKASGLSFAALQNRAGYFVEPTAKSIEAATAALAPRTPSDGRMSLIFAPGLESYPIVNYEYAIVTKRQPDETIAAELARFLRWIVDPAGGNASSELGSVHFVRLPSNALRISLQSISSISSSQK